MPGEEFRKHYNSIHAYLEQYLKTAGGNVSVTYALHVSRMQLHCKVCDEQLTVPELTGPNEISYGVQEFVKIHAHTGGHKDPVQTQGATESYAIPLTLDFKKPGAVKLTGISAGHIDDNLENEKKIYSQMSSYEKELNVKLNDLVLAQKIKQLQAEDKDKALGIMKVQQVSKSALLAAQAAAAAEMLNSNMELKALENVLMIKQLQNYNQAVKGRISGVHVTPASPPKKDKPLKIATGRKFR